MTQQHLHIVYGGELIDPSDVTFKSLEEIDIVGIYPSYDAAVDAWKAQAQRTVDNAHMRYFVATLDPLVSAGSDS